MGVYTTGQWVLLFYFYCFCGWLWESCFVSLRQHRWVNRGFLHGPLLPIYGTGAVLILFVTLPVSSNLWLVYLLGTAAATVLEYVTGAVMERLFRVRYWDYSSHRWNLHGYICLTSSVAWGFFAILLVRFIHPPAARLLADVPDFLVDPAAIVLTVVFTVDVVRSVQAALDLRETLTRLTEENEELRRLARRAEVVSALAEEDLRRFRERTALERLQRMEAREQRTQRWQEALEERLRRRTAGKLEILEAISETLEHAREHLDLASADLESRRAELDEVLERLRQREALLRVRTDRVYRRALRILRGNPSARAQGFEEVMESLKKLGERK